MNEPRWKLGDIIEAPHIILDDGTPVRWRITQIGLDRYGVALPGESADHEQVMKLSTLHDPRWVRVGSANRVPRNRGLEL